MRTREFLTRARENLRNAKIVSIFVYRSSKKKKILIKPPLGLAKLWHFGRSDLSSVKVYRIIDIFDIPENNVDGLKVY